MKYLDFVMLIVFPILFITLFGYIGIIVLLFNLGILKQGVNMNKFDEKLKIKDFLSFEGCAFLVVIVLAVLAILVNL